MTSECVTWVVEQVIRRARTLELPMELDPSAFQHRRPRIATWTAEDPDPTHLTGTVLRIGIHHWVLGEIGPELREVDATLAGLLDRVMIGKSWLEADRRDDVYLLAIGLPGSGDDPAWVAKIHDIESDDRVCRRHGWLPPADPTMWASSLQADVFDRSFLARPWILVERSSDGEAPVILDPITAVQQALMDKARKPGRDFRADRAARLGRWMAILADPRPDDDWRAEQLNATYPENKGKSDG